MVPASQMLGVDSDRTWILRGQVPPVRHGGRGGREKESCDARAMQRKTGLRKGLPAQAAESGYEEIPVSHEMAGEEGSMRAGLAAIMKIPKS